MEGPYGEIGSYKIANCDTSPLTVIFEPEYLDIDGILIDYGDGETESVTNVTNPDLSFTHTYSNPGDYNVNMTFTNASTLCGSMNSSMLVQVRDIHAGFSIPDTICFGKPIVFIAEDQNSVGDVVGRGYA